MLILHALTVFVGTASALTTDTAVVDWSLMGHTAALEDAQPRGPELLQAGKNGRLLLYDGVRREVVVLEADRPALSFPVRHASDLALLDDRALVLDHSAREIELWSLEGDLRSVRSIPDLVPTAVTIGIVGDQVLCIDLFGHGHPLASLQDDELQAPVLSGLQERDVSVVWDGATMATPGLELPLPQAIKASGQRFGDWLIVDEVIADRPIVATRTAWHIPTRQALELPVEGRLYAPRGDVAVTPEGQLVVLVPRDVGLEILRVSP